jgi:hypothetical protein
VDKFKITVEIASLPVDPPREGDKWFMQAAMETGITNPKEQRILNQFQYHQQVLYVSDVLDPGGKCLDKKYLNHCQSDKTWSTLVFSLEDLTSKHLQPWHQVLYSIAPQGWLQNQIRCFITKGHKIWDWQYSEDGKKVYHLKGMVMDVYEPSLVRNYANWPNCWTGLRIDVPQVDQGKICLVKDVALAVKSVVSHAPCPPTKAPPSSLWEVILGWGNTWMWDNLSFMGDLDLIAASTADNSCVAVTDGIMLRIYRLTVSQVNTATPIY